MAVLFYACAVVGYIQWKMWECPTPQAL